MAEATNRAFGILDKPVQSLRQSARKIVRGSAGPIFTARWLTLRKSDFWKAYREIELEVVPALHPRVHPRENVDIAIRWDHIADMTGDAVKLLELSPVAIASEQFVTTRGPIDQPMDLLTLPLLHQRNHCGWLDWFEAMDVQTADFLNGPIFEDTDVLLRGAAEAQGAIVGWLPLIDLDLAENRVDRIFNERITPTHDHFIDVQHTSRARSEVREAEDWLVTQS